MKISALILAKNEEKMIGDCLNQLDFVDEIIVLDQYSQDKTVAIAQEYTKNIYYSASNDFAQNRNLLASKAKSEWLLYLDCDERIRKENIAEILSAIKNLKYSGYYFPRKNIILGTWLKHGGWWPDYVPRLFKKKDLIIWTGKVHESPNIKGSFGYMKNSIKHHTAESVSSMLGKTTQWAKVEAGLINDLGHKKTSRSIVVKVMIKEFILRYILKLGFLDGTIGLIQSIFQSLHKAAVFTYLWEMQNRPQKGKL